MKTFWKILNLTLLLAVAAYAVIAMRHCSQQARALTLGRLEIEVADSGQARFVTPEAIRRHLADSHLAKPGTSLQSVDTYAVERSLSEWPYISEAEAWKTLDGILRIRVSQRRPVLRIVSSSGHDFYIDTTYTRLEPQSHYTPGVPVISGDPALGFPPGEYGPLDEKKFPGEREMLYKLTNFADRVNYDPLLRDLVVQIHIDSGGEIRLLPRVGTQIILFGPLGNVQENDARLEKLSRFYSRSFGDQWWRTARTIDLRYQGQVVCSATAP